MKKYLYGLVTLDGVVLFAIVSAAVADIATLAILIFSVLPLAHEANRKLDLVSDALRDAAIAHHSQELHDGG